MRNATLPFAFVAPALVFLAAVLGWPLLQAVWLSLQDVGVIGSQGRFVGLANYAAVLGDGRFWRALLRSLVWVAGNAAVQTLAALGAALVLNQKFPGVRLARTWIILGWIVPTVVVVIIWRWLLSTSGGMINPLLVQAGVIDRPVGFFATPGKRHDHADPDQFLALVPVHDADAAGRADAHPRRALRGGAHRRRRCGQALHPHHLAAAAADAAGARRGRHAAVVQRLRRHLAAHRRWARPGHADACRCSSTRRPSRATGCRRPPPSR